MKNEFALAFNEVLEEKQLPKEVILAAIESAMVSAYRRAVNASNAQHIVAHIDPETGKVSVSAEKEVVTEIIDDRTEVTLEEARKVNPEAQLDDMVIVECTPKDFGRVAAQTARQVIQQRIREAERQGQSEYFGKQIGEIISGVVQAVNMTNGVTIGLDLKAEGIMPPNQKIPGERFKAHDRVRAVVMEVKDSTRGPQIILSRAHRNFLRRLLENEVPEIYHGIVEIRAIAREPGQRAKVAVSATQPNVDPVGACVGIRGVRIQAIVKELHDEKIDIIEWNPDPVIYISKAISPARVSGVYLNEKEKTATVVVQDDQLSLAIGRDGQNARLAAKLTSWRIDIKSLVEAAGDALNKLQTDPSLAQLAENERERAAQTEALLTKKSEGRPLTPEEYSSLVLFVERVERRQVEQKKAQEALEEERLNKAKEGIPESAYTIELEALGLSNSIHKILTEAGYATVGSLMLAINLDRNAILGLDRIGAKSIEAIEKALAEMKFPEPEPVPEAVVEAVVEEAVVEETAPAAAVEVPAAEAAVETAEVPAEIPAGSVPAVEGAPVPEEVAEEEEVEDEKAFEKMFSLQNIPAVPVEETSEEESPKKKEKKQRKDRGYVRDEERDQVVAIKKHKRGDGDTEVEW